MMTLRLASTANAPRFFLSNRDSLMAVQRYRVTGTRFYLVTAVVVEMMLGWNVIWACWETVDCSGYWPTLSYISAYRGHDRILTFSLSLFSLTLLPFFLSAQTYYHSYLTWEANCLMLLSGLLICALLPWTAVVDEVNTASGVPLEQIHYWLVVTVVFLGTVWTALSLSANTHLKTPFLSGYIQTTWVVTGLCIVQWTFSESIYSNFLLNSHLEAVCEWTALSLSIFTPSVYCHCFPSCSFYLQCS